MKQATIILHNVPHSLDQRLLKLVQKWCAKHPSWEISIRTED